MSEHIAEYTAHTPLGPRIPPSEHTVHLIQEPVEIIESLPAIRGRCGCGWSGVAPRTRIAGRTCRIPGSCGWGRMNRTSGSCGWGRMSRAPGSRGCVRMNRIPGSCEWGRMYRIPVSRGCVQWNRIPGSCRYVRMNRVRRPGCVRVGCVRVGGVRVGCVRVAGIVGHPASSFAARIFRAGCHRSLLHVLMGQ